MTGPDDSPDYVWHFRLSRPPDVPNEDALTEMVRTQVDALLRCLTFTSNGRDVRVTGFRFLDDPGHEHVLRAVLTEEASPGATSAPDCGSGPPSREGQ